MQDVFEKQPDNSGLDKKRRAVEHVRLFMRKSDDYRKSHLELAAKAQELYECWNSVAKSLTHRASLKLPYAYLVVESEHPQLCDLFLKEKPYFKLRGRTADDMGFEDSITDYCAYQLDEMRFAPNFIEFTKPLLVKGTAVAKIPYKYDEQEVTKREVVTDPFLGIQYPTKKTELEVVYDGPDFENIPLEDFFPDWASRAPGSIRAMRGLVHQTSKTISELRSSGKYDEAALNELEQSVRAKGCDAWADPYYSGTYDGNDHRDQLKKKPVKLWEYWGQFDVSGKGDFEEYIVTVANGDVVLRCTPNFYDYKFKPFVAGVNVIQPNEFYGISELFAVRGLIKEATSLRNARLDQVSLAVNRMYVVDRSAGIPATSLYSRPNGIIWTNDMNGIRELPPPEVPASAYREIQDLNSEIQTVTANAGGPSLMEAGRTFGRSATGAAMVGQIASSRAGLKARLLSALFFQDLAHIMMMTNAQFVSEDQWVRVSDPTTPNPFTLLPKSAFHTNYDFEIGTNLEYDNQRDLANLQQFAQLAQIAEGSQPGTIKFDVLFDEIGRRLVGRHVKKFTRTDQERMQMQMMGVAGEQLANAAVGQRAPQPNKAPAR